MASKREHKYEGRARVRRRALNGDAPSEESSDTESKSKPLLSIRRVKEEASRIRNRTRTRIVDGGRDLDSTRREITILFIARRKQGTHSLIVLESDKKWGHYRGGPERGKRGARGRCFCLAHARPTHHPPHPTHSPTHPPSVDNWQSAIDSRQSRVDRWQVRGESEGRVWWWQFASSSRWGTRRPSERSAPPKASPTTGKCLWGAQTPPTSSISSTRSSSSSTTPSRNLKGVSHHHHLHLYPSTPPPTPRCSGANFKFQNTHIYIFDFKTRKSFMNNASVTTSPLPPVSFYFNWSICSDRSIESRSISIPKTEVLSTEYG